jgi:hypothetical protein
VGRVQEAGYDPPVRQSASDQPRCGIPCPMLLAPHGEFYKNVTVIDGKVETADPYGTLRFFEFPTAPQTLHLVLSLYITAEVRGVLSHRVRRWQDELFHSEPVEVHFPDPGKHHQFDYVYDIPDVIFPREGFYAVDVNFDGGMLYTANLSIVQIK